MWRCTTTVILLIGIASRHFLTFRLATFATSGASNPVKRSNPNRHHHNDGTLQGRRGAGKVDQSADWYRNFM
jgi:hypothetical protein